MRPDRIGIWKCCNKCRFNLQERKKLFTRKPLIPSRNIYQVMDLDLLSRDFYLNHVTKRLVRSRFWSPTKYVDGLPKSTLEPVLFPREGRRGGQGLA